MQDDRKPQPDAPSTGQAHTRDANGARNASTRMRDGFDRFAEAVTRWTGSPVAFVVAFACVVIWVVSGPLFHYSDAWQLVINTGTTIITFLMVFLIQQSQNKDNVAVHLKLDGLLAAQKGANLTLIGIESATEESLRQIAAAYSKLADEAAARRGAQAGPVPDDARSTRRDGDAGRDDG